MSQHKNDVTFRHVILGHIKEFHVARLKMFHGSEEDAKRVALLDNNQYQVATILAYRGEPHKRSTMDFETTFEDGSVVWIRYNKDLFDTIQFEDFCRSRPELAPLIFTAEQAKKGRDRDEQASNFGGSARRPCLRRPVLLWSRRV